MTERPILQTALPPGRIPPFGYDGVSGPIKKTAGGSDQDGINYVWEMWRSGSLLRENQQLTESNQRLADRVQTLETRVAELEGQGKPAEQTPAPVEPTTLQPKPTEQPKEKKPEKQENQAPEETTKETMEQTLFNAVQEQAKKIEALEQELKKTQIALSEALKQTEQKQPAVETKPAATTEIPARAKGEEKKAKEATTKPGLFSRMKNRFKDSLKRHPKVAIALTAGAGGALAMLGVWAGAQYLGYFLPFKVPAIEVFLNGIKYFPK